MNRRIKHVTVLGSGIMGSGIAAHFANIGVQVLLLDIVPFELTEAEQKKAQAQTLESEAWKLIEQGRNQQKAGDVVEKQGGSYQEASK